MVEYNCIVLRSGRLENKFRKNNQNLGFRHVKFELPMRPSFGEAKLEADVWVC